MKLKKGFNNHININRLFCLIYGHLLTVKKRYIFTLAINLGLEMIVSISLTILNGNYFLQIDVYIIFVLEKEWNVKEN